MFLVQTVKRLECQSHRKFYWAIEQEGSQIITELILNGGVLKILLLQKKTKIDITDLDYFLEPVGVTKS